MPTAASNTVWVLHKHSQDGVVAIVVLTLILLIIIIRVLLYILSLWRAPSTMSLPKRSAWIFYFKSQGYHGKGYLGGVFPTIG